MLQLNVGLSYHMLQNDFSNIQFKINSNSIFIMFSLLWDCRFTIYQKRNLKYKTYNLRKGGDLDRVRKNIPHA